MLKRLSKLFNMSTTTSTPESFPLFPYLPDELQTLIWKHAVDSDRVLRITLYQQDFPPSAQFLGSSVYGPPWNVKVGCTPELKEATRQVRNLMRVSSHAYKSITRYILPDRIHVTVDWDPPYLREGVSRGEYASKNARMGEKVYEIPWHRRTERVCLEMVHLSRDGVRGVMREEMPRGSDLPAPPVWVNEAGYEPFGDVEPESDSESDPDESRDPSRPSRFYVPPADVIASASASVPDPEPDPDRDLDPRAPGEIYIPHSLAQSITRRHISLAPTFPHLTPVAYGSSNPLLMLCKILRVTNITIIADSILTAGPSPAWVDEHKVLHEPGMAELTRLGAALGDLLEEEAHQDQQDQQQGHDGDGTGTPSLSPLTTHKILARELRTMSLSPRDLQKIRFYRVRDTNTIPPSQDGRRNAREAQRERVGGEWGNGRPGTWTRGWGVGDRVPSSPSRRDGQYGGFGSTRGWWSGAGAGAGGGPWGMGEGGGYSNAAVWRGEVPGPGLGLGLLGLDLELGAGQGMIREAAAGGVGWEAMGSIGAGMGGGMGGGRVLDTSLPVTSMVGPWGSGSESGSGSGMSGFEWL